MVEDRKDNRERVLHDDPLLSRIPEVEGYKVLEPCVLYAKVGEGGMGAVYRGRHLNLDIDVAIKCLKNVLAEQSPAFVTRFQREARIAASVHHQNLVQVYDISEKNGVHYLVMEYVRGETARERVSRKKRLKESEALKILLGAASGLAEAHRQWIVPRVGKPDNILISYDGRVKVSDLGLAKALEIDAGPSLTMGVMGTPQYMAPEQWEDSATVGTQADVWALGATFYYLLTGEHAIPGGSMQQIYRRICVDPFPDIREKLPTISDQACAILERCVQTDPKKRFADCRELTRELSKIVVKEPVGPSLSDAESGTLRVPPLLSPPPAETLGHIRVALSDTAAGAGATKTPASGARGVPAAPAASAPPPSAVPTPASQTPPAPRPRGFRVLQTLAVLLPLLGLAGYLIVRPGRGGGLPASVAEAHPKQDPPKEPPWVEEDVEGVSGATIPLAAKDRPPQESDAGPEEPVREPEDAAPRLGAVAEIPVSERATGPITGATELPEEKTLSVPEPEPPIPAPIPVLTLGAETPLYFGIGAPLVVSGSASSGNGLEIRLIDKEDNVLKTGKIEAGAFRLELDDLGEGRHDLRLEIEAPETASIPVTLVRDLKLPRFQLTGLPTLTNDPQPLLLFGVEDAQEVTVAVGLNEPIPAERAEDVGKWQARIDLIEGENVLHLVATDLAHNTATQDFLVTLDVTPPTEPQVSPPRGIRLVPGQTPLNLEFDEAGLTVEFDGQDSRSSDQDGRVAFTATVPTETKTFELQGRARDPAGNELPLALSWEVQDEPSHPNGWEVDRKAGTDASFRSLHVRDPKTDIWFRLLPGHEPAIYMAETEVTRAQWSQGGFSGGSSASDDLPVTQVTWREARKYCQKFGYELPPPPLWREACLAGVSGKYCCPLKELSFFACFRQPSASPVGKRKANAYGLFDMHGNVWEWCSQENEALGGSYYTDAESLSAATDSRPKTAGGGTSDIGFRPIYREPR